MPGSISGKKQEYIAASREWDWISSNNLQLDQFKSTVKLYLETVKLTAVVLDLSMQ